MIESFRDTWLEELFNGINPVIEDAPLAVGIRAILNQLDNVQTLNDLFDGLDARPYADKPFWSVLVREGTRIAFRFENGNLYEVHRVE